MKNTCLLLSFSLYFLGCQGDKSNDTVAETTTSNSTMEGETTSESTIDEHNTTATEAVEGGYVLRIDDSVPPPVVLEMDQKKALEVFGEAAKNIKLLDVDSTALLIEALTQIQNSCGTNWKLFLLSIDENLPLSPKPNCSLTTLGKSYGSEWQTSPEYAMVRLLTMTPRNGNLAGTTFGSLWTYFHTPEKNNNAFGLSFEDILAATLFCPDDPADPDDTGECVKSLKSFAQEENPSLKKVEQELHMQTFIPLDILAEALKRTLMYSHPNINNPKGILPISLYDALMNMQTLSEKFGPIDVHPGLLMLDDSDMDGIPEFATRSDALLPTFRMIATAESNLRRVDGIDASIGSGSMFINHALAPLTFDFMDENKVQIIGIKDVPTVDMRMKINELDIRIDSCDEDPVACKTNLPNSPLGTNYIWSAPLWSLERIIAEAAYETYKNRHFDYCFIKGNPCDALVQIGAGNDPPGWSAFDVTIGASMPKPQFFWELLLDVAQTALHDFTGPDINDVDKDGDFTEILPAANGEPELDEGQVNPIFALKEVPIGLTAEEMIAQIRPTLQAQADKIAEVILGNYWQENDHLDFYYRRGEDGGAPYLYFAGSSDKRPDPTNPSQLAAYNYKNPGFFADLGLTQKVSSTSIEGVADTEHEKYRLPEGESVLYMQDDTNSVYKLHFIVPSHTDQLEINVRVHKL